MGSSPILVMLSSLIKAVRPLPNVDVCKTTPKLFKVKKYTMTFNDLTMDEKALVLQVYGNISMENPDVTLEIVTQRFVDRKMNGYKLYDVAYRMNMRGGFQNDAWGIFGNCPERPQFPNGVFISTPVEYDEVKKTIRTYSGSLYRIESFDCDETKFWEQVKKDIANGSYEYH